MLPPSVVAMFPASATQHSFTDELREIIGGAAEIAATLETCVTMARRR
jgi:hypothetical protein